MLREDSIILDLVKRVNAITHREEIHPTESMDALRDPGFEEFLIKANQGIALTSSSGFFYYISKSLSLMLGHPLTLLYEKGPSFFQQLIATNERQLVEDMITQSQHAIDRLAHPVKDIRVSFDYHIVSGLGDRKRVYQHTLPATIFFENNYYTLFILMDLTGFKSSPTLSYRVSHLAASERFEHIASGTANPSSPYRLTKRENDLLRRLAAGKSMKEIASSLFISFVTLKKHRQNILRKTGAKNMVALVHEGFREGWIQFL